MKLLVFGDLHGDNRWRNHVKDIDKYDYVIFMGDYMDSFTHLDVELIDNLENLIHLKAKFPNKVILLLGNHDNQYIYPDYTETHCSGFRRHLLVKVKNRYRYNLDFFTTAFQYQDILFTHAGLLNNHFTKLNNIFKKENDMRYDTYLNLFFEQKPRAMFAVSAFRGGEDSSGGIFWADWAELANEKNNLPINQVVGHSERYGGNFELKNGHFIFNADSVKINNYYEIFKNENKDWIIKTLDF